MVVIISTTKIWLYKVVPKLSAGSVQDQAQSTFQTDFLKIFSPPGLIVTKYSFTRTSFFGHEVHYFNNELRWIYECQAAPWSKLLDARLPPLGSRVSFLVTPCKFHGGRNGVWVVSPVFPCHKFHSVIFPSSTHSFHFIRPWDGAPGGVGRHPYY